MSAESSDELRVALVDLDAFYVSVELARRPELRGQPVVVAGSGPRAVVTTASYEARRYGVGSAMPAARARRLCPQAVFLTPDFQAYRAVSAQVMAIIRSRFELVEVVGLDEAYVDLEGFHSPRAAMRRLIAEIAAATGLTCSVGIGPNKLVAKVASDAEKPSGFVVLTREEACRRFADAAPGLIPGIGPKTSQRLQALGVKRLLELRALPAELLVEHFGPNHGHDLQSRARFEHSGPVGAPRKAVSESRERTFDRDISDPATMRAALATMCEELCASLERSARQGRTIAIKVRLADFRTFTRSRTLARATRAPAQVSEVALALLSENAPEEPVRLLGVRMASFQADGAEDGAAPTGAPPGLSPPDPEADPGEGDRPRRPREQLSLGL